MGFPRPAPMKPKQMNRMAQFKLGTGTIAVGAVIYVVHEAIFGLTPKYKELSEAILLSEQPMRGARGFDAERIRAEMKILDEKAKFNLQTSSSYTDAAKSREAKYKFEDASLSDEVREYFIKRSENEKSEEKDITNLEKVEPGVYGKVVVTRLPKENNTEETTQ